MSPIQIPFSLCKQSCPLGFRKTPDHLLAFCCYYCAPCPAGEITNETGIYKMVLNVEISRNDFEWGNYAALDGGDNRKSEDTVIFM